MIKDKIDIGRDFSDSPAGRYRTDWGTSGQAFLENILMRKFSDAVQSNYQIEIDLDGVWWLPSSFISGSFWKLSLQFGSEKILNHLLFVAKENPMRIEEVLEEIKNPERVWKS